MIFYGARFTGWFSFGNMRLEAKRYEGVRDPVKAHMWFGLARFEGSHIGFAGADLTGGVVDLRGAHFASPASFADVTTPEAVQFDSETRYVRGVVDWGTLSPGPAVPIRRAVSLWRRRWS